jgi:hypothetical protein
VIDRYAVVEAALFVELDDLFNGEGRGLLAYVVKGAAVPEGGEWWPIKFIEAEEPADSETVKTVPLGEGVFAPRSIDQGLRQQDAGIRWRRNHLVRVTVITLANSVRRRSFALEVEAWIDLVLAVRKEEVHLLAPPIRPMSTPRSLQRHRTKTRPLPAFTRPIRLAGEDTSPRECCLH